MGNQISVGAAGAFVTTLYNAQNRVTGTINAEGNLTTYLYDLRGLTTEIIMPSGLATTYAYDAAGQLISTTVGAGTASAETTTNYYSAAGLVTGTADGLGNLTQYELDGLGRATVTITPLTSGTSSTVTTLYDTAGNVTEVIDADNNTTTYLYDALNRVTSQTQELGSGYSTTTFAYNSQGLLSSQTDALGRRETFDYDALGRMTAQYWYNASGTLTETFTSTYDAAGDLLTATNNAGTYTMQYDALSQVTAVAEPYGVALSFGYDSVGNRTSVKDYETVGGTLTAGFSIYSTYDGSNRLSSITAYGGGGYEAGVDLTYTPDSQISTETRYGYSSGVVQVGSTSFVYDALDRVTAFDYYYGSGSPLGSIAYSYDSANNVTSETDNGATPTSYSYNKSNELTQGGATTYAYDAQGNRTQAGTFTYSTPNSGNELSNDGTWTYLYDAAGNITEKYDGTDTWTYSYDNANHMLTAKEELTTTSATLAQATYTYDYFGNLLQETYYTTAIATATVEYAYDGWNPADKTFEAWAMLNSSNQLTARFVRGDQTDQLFASISSGTPSWILQDRLGSTRFVADNNGTSVDATYTYDAYGNLTTTAPTAPTYLWTGQLYDPATALYYERARFYDPETGRWTTQDPLGLAAGDSDLYRYVNNAPTNHTDPTGLDPGEGGPKIFQTANSWLDGALSPNTYRSSVGALILNNDPLQYTFDLPGLATQTFSVINAEDLSLQSITVTSETTFNFGDTIFGNITASISSAHGTINSTSVHAAGTTTLATSNFNANATFTFDSLGLNSTLTAAIDGSGQIGPFAGRFAATLTEQNNGNHTTNNFAANGTLTGPGFDIVGSLGTGPNGNIWGLQATAALGNNVSATANLGPQFGNSIILNYQPTSYINIGAGANLNRDFVPTGFVFGVELKF